MKDWKHHYAEAEAWLERSTDPNQGYRAEQMLARAQVHATLASLEMEEGDFEEPEYKAYQPKHISTDPGVQWHIPAQRWAPGGIINSAHWTGTATDLNAKAVLDALEADSKDSGTD